METFIFSYNRGRYLRNCLESLERHAPHSSITVIDDMSTDPDVHAVLDRFADRVAVVSSDEPKGGHHLGGLYANMNHAVRSAKGDIALFIQDDMQIVRDLTSADIEHCNRFFDRYPDSVELHNGFFKRTQGPKNRQDIEIDSETPVYFRKPDARGSVYFSAVGIIHVGRLRKLEFVFSNFESGNDERLSSVAGRMGIAPFPSMMWLPFAETSKFRQKGFLQRYAEWKTGAGFYPYRPLNDEEVEQLCNHDLRDVPLAEEWLDPQGMPERTIWNFADAAKFVPLTRKVLKMRKRFRRKVLRRT